MQLFLSVLVCSAAHHITENALPPRVAVLCLPTSLICTMYCSFDQVYDADADACLYKDDRALQAH